MALISLSEAKNHLRVDQSDEDTLIQTYIDAAIDYIGNYLNCANYPQAPSVKAAALLIVADLYENREAQLNYTVSENMTVCNLLYPYRKELGI